MFTYFIKINAINGEKFKFLKFIITNCGIIHH